jgi:DNA-binding NarL/FixJ family response regulator
MNLLIVDDHPLFREGLKQTVAKIEGIGSISEAETGEAALALIRYDPPSMIMLDLAMPGMDGIELLEQLRAEDIKVNVVVVTSYDDKAYLDRAFDLGARGYVLKDSAVSDVIDCIEAIRTGGIYISPSLGRSTPVLPSADNHVRELLRKLTQTELAVLSKVAEFMTSKEIARELDMSFRTVQNHRSHICSKLGLHGPHQLMSFASEHAALISFTR